MIQKIVIAGAGTMGSSMAQIYAEYFDDVILYNHRQETLELAKERIESNVATLVETGNLTKEKADSLLGALSYTTSMECFKTCDFVAENLSENLEIKDDFYKKLSEVISNTAVITTNTSGMSINLLSRSVKWPERFIGMHWFNPPHLVPLIEIIKGEKTREDVAQTVYDHRQETLELAKERIESNVATLVETGNLTKEKADSLLGALSYTTSMECFKTCDFVAENLSENLEIKDDFYKKLSEVISNTAVITTNTSGMSINLLSRSVKWPERFIGMHWFNPPHLVPLIEIIKGEKTREDVAQTVYDLSLKIGKKPVLVNRDIPGFAANRLQFAILREALALVAQGVVSAEGIDDVMKYGLGFRYACLGPLEVADFGGLDTFTHISSYLMKDLCDSKEVPELMQAHFDAGEYGVKSEKGFYDYSDGRAKEATKERDEKFLKVYQALYGSK